MPSKYDTSNPRDQPAMALGLADVLNGAGDAADALGAAIGQRMARNAFSVFKAKADAGQSATLLIDTDSTGNCRDNAGRWPEKLATRLAAYYPTHSVYLVNWNTTSGNSWDAATQISTGSTSATIYIYNFAVSGSVPQYGMGGTFPLALGCIPCDGLIIGHGINWFPGWDVSGQGGASVRGAAYAFVQQFLVWHPDCPISAIVQNPNRDTTALDNMPIYWKQIAASLGISLITAVYDTYIAQGKASGLYLPDGIHPSEPAGNTIYSDAVWAEFLAAGVSNLRGRRGTLLNRGKQFLLNPDFSTWTTQDGSTAPDNWTKGGTIAFTRDTSVYADPSSPFSVKMLGSGSGQTYIRQEISDAAKVAQMIAGKELTLGVRKKVGTAGASSVGRFQLVLFYGAGSNITYSSVSYVLRQDDFAWWALSGVPVPTDLTSVRVNLFQDSATTPDTTNAAWYDQVSLATGKDIVAARAA